MIAFLHALHELFLLLFLLLHVAAKFVGENYHLDLEVCQS